MGFPFHFIPPPALPQTCETENVPVSPVTKGVELAALELALRVYHLLASSP